MRYASLLCLLALLGCAEAKSQPRPAVPKETAPEKAKAPPKVAYLELSPEEIGPFSFATGYPRDDCVRKYDGKLIRLHTELRNVFENDNIGKYIYACNSDGVFVVPKKGEIEEKRLPRPVTFHVFAGNDKESFKKLRDQFATCNYVRFVVQGTMTFSRRFPTLMDSDIISIEPPPPPPPPPPPDKPVPKKK